jgi:hypothetical protein
MAPAPPEALTLATEGQAGHAYEDRAEPRRIDLRQGGIRFWDSECAGMQISGRTDSHGADQIRRFFDARKINHAARSEPVIKNRVSGDFVAHRRVYQDRIRSQVKRRSNDTTLDLVRERTHLRRRKRGARGRHKGAAVFLFFRHGHCPRRAAGVSYSSGTMPGVCFSTRRPHAGCERLYVLMPPWRRPQKFAQAQCVHTIS